GGRSIASLEDPIEAAIDGVAQSQVDLAAGFDMAKGLRNLLRLDPEVIFIGEMRDEATAEVALQAPLTGQLVDLPRQSPCGCCPSFSGAWDSKLCASQRGTLDRCAALNAPSVPLCPAGQRRGTRSAVWYRCRKVLDWHRLRGMSPNRVFGSDFGGRLPDDE